MNPRETLTMSQKEAPRAGLLKALVAGRVTGGEVAAALHLSDRQVRRLRRRFETEGAEGLLHRSRGRPSRRRLARRVRQRVALLLRTTYRDFNDCHATEKLQEVEGLALSRPTVRRLRQALGRPAKHRRRPRQYRARREPRARMGALVQLDASPFAWLEARGPAMSLHGAIDDATGTVLALHFRPTEDLHGYTTLLAAIATHYGLPLAFYGDRLNVFLRNDTHWTLAEELHGAQSPTHFGQMLQSLGIGLSPPALRRPRGASSGCGRPCRIVSSVSCACAALPRSRPPMPSCPPSSPTTTGASRGPRPARSRPGGARRATSPSSSPAGITAASPPTTPCASPCAACNCRPAPAGGAGRARMSSSGNCSMAASSSCTTG